MNNVDTRQVNRDSLFLLAQIRVAGQDDVHQVKVRNLSVGGMMGEGPVKVARGALVEVQLRNIGWVEGSVAWKQDERFGIAFIKEIDPVLARAPINESKEYASSRFVRTPATLGTNLDPAKLRKV